KTVQLNSSRAEGCIQLERAKREGHAASAKVQRDGQFNQSGAAAKKWRRSLRGDEQYERIARDYERKRRHHLPSASGSGGQRRSIHRDDQAGRTSVIVSPCW